jgi:hypothetical protein
MINAKVYIYMAVFFIFLAGGLFIQYKYYTPEDEEKKTDKDIETTLNEV